MKITAINIPENELGLRSGRISGFGDLVLLAGSNGAGKTRLLRLLQRLVNGALEPSQRIQLSFERTKLAKSVEEHRSRAMSIIAGGASPDAPEVVSTFNSIQKWQQTLDHQSRQLNDDAMFERDPDLKPVVVCYDVEHINLRDWKDIPHREVQKCAMSIASEFSVRIVPEAGLSAVRTLINRYVYASQGGVDELASLQAEVERLKVLIREFIGAELGWDLDGDPTLFGRPIASAGLSGGQLVLLQIALSLFFQRGDREELILLMDEPERHLHPLATITMIDEVRRKCPKAQFWIATHSLHILAHADPGDIWFVKDGAVEHAGAKSLDVLHALVGGDAGVDELLEFVALPAQNALLHFASQCLLPPSVVDTELGDPQTTQITQILSGLCREDRPLRILDFGMGKGRLLSELTDSVRVSGKSFEKAFDYFGVDSCSTLENRELCEGRLTIAYGSASSRYFDSMATLAETVNKASFDVIVMCNTLHEIPPEEWLTHFGASGRLSRLLKEDGYLLVVEDQLLPAGERAHRYGYLVLDAQEIRALTQTPNEDRSFVSVDSPIPRYLGRLRAHLVPAGAVRRVTSDTCKAALKSLRERSLDAAKDLSGEQFDTRRVRRFAFWSHQHVNASLALQAIYGSE